MGRAGRISPYINIAWKGTWKVTLSNLLLKAELIYVLGQIAPEFLETMRS